MLLPNARGQRYRDFMYDASGTIATGGTAQRIVPECPQRSMFVVQNISDTNMFVEIGGARASATITGGAVTSIAVTNSGFGYTIPPTVHFYGGGNLQANPTYLGPGQPGVEGPSSTAKAHAVLSGGSVSAIVIDNPGANYVNAPYVFLQNSVQDPFGCATPSATSGVLLTPTGGSLYINTTATTTDAVSIFCASTGKAFTFKYMI